MLNPFARRSQIDARLEHITKKAEEGAAALSQYGNLDQELRNEHAERLRRRDQLQALPPTADEIVGNSRTLVDALALKFAQDLGPAVVQAFGGRYERDYDANAYRQVPPRLPAYFALRPALTFQDLCGLAPELVKGRLEAIIRGAATETSSSLAERPSLLAKIDAEIRAIEDAHEALVERAAAMTPPVVLTHLEAVQQRRDAAAQRAREQEAGEQRRRELEQQARNSAARQENRSTRRAWASSYLTQNR